MAQQEERNTATLRKAYAEWNATKAGRTDMWTSMMADQFRLCSVTDSAINGLDFCRVYTHREQLSEYFAAIAKDWEMIYFDLEELIAQANKVAALSNTCWRSRRTGKEAAVKVVHIWKFDDAGMATDLFETFDTATAISAMQPG